LRRRRALKVCYVDETGTDGKSPVIVMAGIVADGRRLHRTQADFAEVFAKLGEMSLKTLRELKSVDLFRGNGVWRGVDGEVRHQVISELCDWLCDRKHQIALAAIDRERFRSEPLQAGLDDWMTAALHIALQVQRAHQVLPKNKGATFLVFDEHQQHEDQLAELLFDPPSWTDGYYGLGKKQSRFDQVIDTAFYARSHHVGLVQVADLFAFLFRRFSELIDYGLKEEFPGEIDRISEWAHQISTRLLPSADRWPQRTKDDTARWYVSVAPKSLVGLG
jgi:hypothetical protein